MCPIWALYGLFKQAAFEVVWNRTPCSVRYQNVYLLSAIKKDLNKIGCSRRHREKNEICVEPRLSHEGKIKRYSFGSMWVMGSHRPGDEIKSQWRVRKCVLERWRMACIFSKGLCVMCLFTPRCLEPLYCTSFISLQSCHRLTGWDSCLRAE